MEELPSSWNLQPEDKGGSIYFEKAKDYFSLFYFTDFLSNEFSAKI